MDKPLSRLREKLADYAHAAWSGWMQYQFGKMTVRPCQHIDGSMESAWVMPAWAAERWRRQMITTYPELSHQEKESDRKEADAMIAILNAWLEEEGMILVPLADYEKKVAADVSKRLEDNRGRLLEVLGYARSTAVTEGGKTEIVRAVNLLMRNLVGIRP